MAVLGVFSPSFTCCSFCVYLSKTWLHCPLKAEVSIKQVNGKTAQGLYIKHVWCASPCHAVISSWRCLLPLCSREQNKDRAVTESL